MTMTGRTLRRLIVMMGIILPASACVTMTPQTADPLAGCYYFERDVVADTLRLPWGIRLLADSLDGWPAMQQQPGVRRAVTLVGPEQVADFPFGYWRPLADDAVEIGYPAGGGLLLTLEVGATHLTGSARAVGDALPLHGEVDRSAQRVSLMRATCP
jgi:hypothetical protein